MAIAAAKRALPEWSMTSVTQRAVFLERIADRIQARFEEFVAAESMDCGKPYSMARSVDIPRAIDNFRFFAGAIRHDETSCHEMVVCYVF